MNNKNIVFIAFILVAMAQLFVPASMIWDKETILEEGTIYKFKTAPIDPNDPFRGKYINLHFDDNAIVVENADEWMAYEEVFVHLTTNNEGFARIKSVSKEAPAGNQDYLKANVNNVYENELTIDYPFDRFYMEESKAYEAELSYRESQRDAKKNAWALVSIKNGDAVLKDVLIEGVPIKEIVKANREREESN